MRRWLLLSVFVVSVLAGVVPSVRAQRIEPLDTWHEYDTNGNAKVNVRVNQHGLYTVVLELDDVYNMQTQRMRRINVRNSGTIAELTIVNPYEDTRFKYRHRWVYGTVNPQKIDSQFVYRLPFDAQEVLYAGNRFILNRGDTIRAVRKGIVVGVFSLNTTAIVQHADGTIAYYNLHEENGITVKSHTVVYPGTAIGRIGDWGGFNGVYPLSFGIYYQTDNFKSITTAEEYETTTSHIDPVFSTSRGEMKLINGNSYTPVVSDELTHKEMTKKEIKKQQNIN